MRIGVALMPSLRWREAERLWRWADEAGFDHAWTFDHLTWRTMREGPWFAALPTLTAAATATLRIRLGTLVASPNFRHPVTLAKEAMTVDDVSAGRFTLGLGAGGMGFDASALGQAAWTRGERTARFAEFVEHLDALLAAPATAALDGTFYAAREARTIPASAQGRRLPFALAAAGPRGLRVVARFAQTWVTLGHPTWPDTLTTAEQWEVVRRQAVALDEACAAEQRDPATLARLYMAVPSRERLWDAPETFAAHVRRLAALGFGDVVVHYPHPGTPFDVGTPARFERVMEAVLGAR